MSDSMFVPPTLKR